MGSQDVPLSVDSLRCHMRKSLGTGRCWECLREHGLSMRPEGGSFSAVRPDGDVRKHRVLALGDRQ